jgi:hypothetical protein
MGKILSFIKGSYNQDFVSINLNKNGFGSIVEIIITAVIFVFSAFGILTAMSYLKPQSAKSSKKLEAAYVGRQVLDELRGSVSAENWWTGGSLDPAGSPYTSTIGVHDISYTVSDFPTGCTSGPNGDCSARKVIMTLTYPGN